MNISIDEFDSIVYGMGKKYQEIIESEKDMGKPFSDDSLFASVKQSALSELKLRMYKYLSERNEQSN